MKKFYLVSIFICGLFNLHSQTYITLTFKGRDSVSHNPVLLDSVHVANLSQPYGGDTLTLGPDSVLILQILVGINEIIGSNPGAFILNQNYPNPFKGSTFVSLYRGYRGSLNLLLSDGLGKKLAEYHNDFERGSHSFVISSSENNVLLLTVFDDKNYRSIKIISNGHGNENNSINYLGHNMNIKKGSIKNSYDSDFPFTLGDRLEYTAYSIGFIKKTITDTVNSDSTYYFTMWKMLVPSVTTSLVTNITQTTATSGGWVHLDGGDSVTAKGVYWGKLTPPQWNDFTTDGSDTGSFTSQLYGLTPNTIYHVKAYATNSVGIGYGDSLTFTTLPFICGDSITINHIAGTVAPVNKTVTYGTVTNIPGEPTKCWITSNLGSDHQATAVDDATEASAGWYWQFNRKQGYKHDGTTRTPATTWISSIVENSDWVAANDPCVIELGDGWRIPTYTEWSDVRTAGGPWINSSGPWNSALKLHEAGRLYSSDGSLMERGYIAYFWTSTQYTPDHAYFLVFKTIMCNLYSDYKPLGYTLRCIRN